MCTIGKPILPADATVLQERAGDKISIWDWINFFFTPNIISSIIGN